MKNCLRVTFALLVIIGLVVPAQAGIVLEVTSLGSPFPGLDEFIVTAVGTDGDLVGGFSGLALTGAHQVWKNLAFDPTSIGTPKDPVIFAVPFEDPAWHDWDSHWIPDLSLGIAAGGLVIVDTNDASNPAGIPDVGPGAALDPFGGFAGRAGHGDVTFTGNNPGWALTTPVASLDFLHVVTASGALLQIEVGTDGGSTGGTPEIFQFEITIPIPEPTSFALLGIGLVALLGYRRRS